MAHTDPPLPAQGGCRCGKLRFEITAPALLTSACHCTGCQRMTGGAYSVTSAYPLDGFRVVDGEPVLGGLKGPVAHHHHCDHCKSWVYTTAEGAPFVNVRSTMLDDPSGFEPFIEVWTAEKLPWVTTPAVHSYESQPAYEDYEGLIGEFMGRGK